MDRYLIAIKELEKEIGKIKTDQSKVELMLKEITVEICHLKNEIYIDGKTIENYNYNIEIIRRQSKSLFFRLLNFIGRKISKKILSFDEQVLYWTNECDLISSRRLSKQDKLKGLETKKNSLEKQNCDMQQLIASKTEDLNCLVEKRNSIIDMIHESLIEQEIRNNTDLDRPRQLIKSK